MRSAGAAPRAVAAAEGLKKPAAPAPWPNMLRTKETVEK
jgi:hypothetical protein